MRQLAVVFDLDGTLIDSVPDVCAALNRMLAEMDAGPLTVADVSATIGEGASWMIEHAVIMAGLDAKSIDLQDCLRRYLGHYRDYPVEYTQVYPGVHEVLEQFAAAGVLMGVCTNKPSIMSDLVLAELRLDKFFSAVTGGDSVPHRKPDGRHICLTLELMNAGTRQPIMVGDSETDMEAAHDARIPSVAVTYGYPRFESGELDADIVIDQFAQLPGALQRILAKLENSGIR